MNDELHRLRNSGIRASDGKCDRLRSGTSRSAASSARAMPWFRNTPPGRSISYTVRKYCGSFLAPTCSNMPTLAILSKMPRLAFASR